MPEVSASTVSQVDPLALDVLFNEARTHNVWQEKEVEDKILEDLYSLMKMAPTSCSLVRVGLWSNVGFRQCKSR